MGKWLWARKLLHYALTQLHQPLRKMHRLFHATKRSQSPTTWKKLKQVRIEFHTIKFSCAHRLELAVKDGAKKCRRMNIIDNILENASKMYHKSPLCWQGLQETGKTMNLPHKKKPTKLKGTRWVANRQRALAFVLESCPVIVEHTGQVLLGTSMCGRATKLQKLLILPDMVLSMYLIKDMLTVLSRLSCALQQKDATIHTLLHFLRSVRFELERMCRPNRLKARVSAVLVETEATSTNAEATRIMPGRATATTTMNLMIALWNRWGAMKMEMIQSNLSRKAEKQFGIEDSGYANLPEVRDSWSKCHIPSGFWSKECCSI